MPSLGGKGGVDLRATDTDASVVSTTMPLFALLPPASAYVDVEGTIWIAPELGAYVDNPTGEVSILLDIPPHEAQNVYFDR